MNTKLTLRLDEDVINRIKNYCLARLSSKTTQLAAASELDLCWCEPISCRNPGFQDENQLVPIRKPVF